MNGAKLFEALKNGDPIRWSAPPKRCLGHKMVVMLAMKMANEDYERYAYNNEWYAQRRNRKDWICAATPFYTEAARATLAGMLGGSYSENLKQQIADALVMDNAFRGKRDASQQTSHQQRPKPAPLVA